MQKLLSRIVALILASTLLFASPIVAFAENTIGMDQSVSEIQADNDDQEIPDFSAGEEEVQLPFEEETPGVDIEDSATIDEMTDVVTEEMDDMDTEEELCDGEDLEEEVDLMAAVTPTVIDTTSIKMKYDDRKTLTTYYPGYVVAYIQTDEITSYKVDKGVCTKKKDTDIAKLMPESDVRICVTGIGNGLIYMSKAEDVTAVQEIMDGTYKGDASKIKVKQINITTTPAKLTMIYLAGQSNAEGNCGAKTDYCIENSVKCTSGRVYSSYAPHPTASSNTDLIAGVSGLKGYNSLIAGNLGYNSKKAIDGAQLIYPIYQLTEMGTGKTGPDSGLAYEWNRLTGDKVWVVNAAVGGTPIGDWANNGAMFTHAMNYFRQANQTANAEIASGHYKKSKKLFVWLQGESNPNMGVTSYYNQFLSIYNQFNGELGFDCAGIIAVRRNVSETSTISQVSFNGVREAQYALGEKSTSGNIILASNVNEQWTSDKGVSSYFSKAYPNGISYPLRNNTKLKTLPKTVAEVHPTIHYNQVAHNENGIDAARNIYNYLYAGAASTTAQFVNPDNKAMTSVKVNVGDAFTVIAQTNPCYMLKNMDITYDTTYIKPTKIPTEYVAIKNGTTYIKVKDQSGTTLASLKVSISGTVNSCDTPVLLKATNGKDFVKVTWESVQNASKYRVFYKSENDTSWKKAGDTTETTFDVTGLNSGTRYYFSVRCINTAGTLYESSYDKKGISCLYIAAPVLENVGNAATGVKVSWNAVEGCSQYRVFRKISGVTGWEIVGDTTDTSYTVTGLKSGTTYTFTVRCLSADGNKYISSYDSKGKKIVYLTVPKLGTATNTAAGQVTLTWTKVTGATAYNVYRKPAGGKWSVVEVVTSGSTVKYVDKTVKKGTTYYYTVRAVNGNSISRYDKNGVMVKVTK